MMKPVRGILLACLLAAVPVLGAPPKAVTLHYDMSRNGMVMVEVTERIEHDGSRYLITYEAKGKGIYSLLRSGVARRSSRGTIGGDGLRPIEFRDRRGDNPEALARFDWTRRTVQQGVEGKLDSQPMTERLQDRLSFVWNFSFVAPPGKEITATLADGHGLSVFRYANQGTETLKTAAGDIEALRLVKQRAPGDERATEIWLAVRHHFLPVRILVTEKDGTRLDQLLTRIES
jgi:hypothetical protein